MYLLTVQGPLKLLFVDERQGGINIFVTRFDRNNKIINIYFCPVVAFCIMLTDLIRDVTFIVKNPLSCLVPFSSEPDRNVLD